MRTSKQSFSNRASVSMLRAALLGLALLPSAHADEQDDSELAKAELTRQSSQIELGIGYVDKDSFKYGEYNGLNSQGAYGIGNLDLRGGGVYDSSDPTRWRVSGSNLGLDTRDISAEYGRQGSFRLKLDYDEIRRNRSDSYQSPYLGTGTNRLTLPANWAVPVVPRVNAATPNARGLSSAVAQSPAIVGGVPTAPTGPQLAASNTLLATDLPAFHNVDLDTKRKRTDIDFSSLLNENWEFKASFRHEDKDGLKPMGAASRQKPNATTNATDITAIIPDVIDQSTDQVDLGFHFTGDRSFLQVGYYGSFFKNHVDSMTWQNWAVVPSTSGTFPNTNTMSSAPSNEFHQLTLTGGYDFSTSTHLVVDAALGRSSQNDNFLSDATTPVVPVSSANALVISKNFSLKLTGRPVTALQLSAGYKFDERDNHTPVHTYQFSDNNQPLTVLAAFPGNAVVAQNANANLPYSKRVHRLDLDADYRLAKGQSVKAGYQFEKIDRWCDGSWIDCTEAATTKENTLRLEYRNSVAESLSGRIGYEYAKRTVDNYNENAFLSLVPFANVSPTGAPNLPNGVPATAYNTMVYYGLNGWGPNSGFNPVAPAGSALAYFFGGNNALSNALYANENRISELPGMRRYNMADRDRNKLRTALNWQASERWGLQSGINVNRDKYPDSDYGLKESRGWSLNLDANYQASEDFSVNTFYTYEDQHMKSAGNTYTANSNAASVNGFTAISGGCYATILERNLNNKIDPCENWSADLHDRIDTLGIAFQRKGLMAGKLQLSGDLSMTRARSDSGFTGGNYVNNPLAVAGAPAGTIAAYYIPATALPTVTTKSIDLHLAADYKIDQQSSARFGLFYSRLRSVDWAYDGMQPGGLTQLMPSNEQSPNYSIYAFAVSYVYRFR